MAWTIAMIYVYFMRCYMASRLSFSSGGVEMFRRSLCLGIATLVVAGHVAHAQRVHNAAADGNLARLKSVLSCDGDLVHATDHMGATPLHLAALEGHADVVEHLLEAGSPANATEAHGLTPLHYAVLRGQASVIGLLTAGGADPNFSTAAFPATPMELAALADAFRGTTVMTEMLAAAGGTIDPEGAAPGLPSMVFTAYLAGNADLVRLLHEYLAPEPGTTVAPEGSPALD